MGLKFLKVSKTFREHAIFFVFLVGPSVDVVLSRRMDVALPSLSCFLCHGMVQFIDKNPMDFKNHMITQHKAFFNLELSIACSVMDEKESKSVVRQYIDLKFIDNIKKEDEVFLKEDQLKQENIVSMEEETYNANNSDIFKGEYMEDKDIIVKEEDTTQKPSFEPQPKPTDMSMKAVSYKRPAEELVRDQPHLKVPSSFSSSSPFTVIFTRSVS